MFEIFQIGNIPSSLRIVDFSHGPTGSAHDASAFEHTCASRFPDFLFDGQEFAWGDSAYAVSPRMMPVHKRPAADIPANQVYDKAVSRLRVRSEHCIGALKGRWQCLRGLRVDISSPENHVRACRWITIAIILHNLVIDTEGTESAAHFYTGIGGSNEGIDRDIETIEPEVDGDEDEEGEAKRRVLVEEVNYIRSLRHEI
jgi:hypothetical protein